MKHLYIKDYKKRLKFAQNEKKYIILKFLLNNINLTAEQRLLLNEKLKRINKKSNNTKINNRCSITYRSHSVLRKFKLSRIRLRELISLGLVPGYKKAVW